MKRPVNFMMLIVTIMAIASAGLTGCGKSMSGTYQDSSGFMAIEFKSDKAYMKGAGVTTEVEYKVEGDKVLLVTQMGKLVLTREPDGSLSGFPGGVTLKKKD